MKDIFWKYKNWLFEDHPQLYEDKTTILLKNLKILITKKHDTQENAGKLLPKMTSIDVNEKKYIFDIQVEKIHPFRDRTIRLFLSIASNKNSISEKLM